MSGQKKLNVVEVSRDESRGKRHPGLWLAVALNIAILVQAGLLFAVQKVRVGEPLRFTQPMFSCGIVHVHPTCTFHGPTLTRMRPANSSGWMSRTSHADLNHVYSRDPHFRYFVDLGKTPDLGQLPELVGTFSPSMFAAEKANMQNEEDDEDAERTQC